MIKIYDNGETYLIDEQFIYNPNEVKMIKCVKCGIEFRGWWTAAFFAGWLYRVVNNVQEWYCPVCRKELEDA